MNEKQARSFLTQAGVFFCCDDTDKQTLNMNDVWGWACADGEDVKDDELPEVARLFFNYGFCGILYWASKKNNFCRSEFYHYNRYIDFVAEEERLRDKFDSESGLAYYKTAYKIKGVR